MRPVGFRCLLTSGNTVTRLAQPERTEEQRHTVRIFWSQLIKLVIIMERGQFRIAISARGKGTLRTAKVEGLKGGRGRVLLLYGHPSTVTCDEKID